MLHVSTEVLSGDGGRDDASWLAIRQPAVIKLLERELGGFAGFKAKENDRRERPPLVAFADGDAFAAGLELATRVLAGPTPLGDLRLDHKALANGLAAVRAGACDRAMVRSIRDQIEELPVVLTPLEQDGVATVIAAVIWAVLDASVRDLDDTLVA
jgi:hypothetical protein